MTDAVSFCENAGARLCTRTELEGVSNSTGCNHDFQLRWSSTSFSGGYYAVHKHNDPITMTMAPVCADPVSSAHTVTRCADTFTCGRLSLCISDCLLHALRAPVAWLSSHSGLVRSRIVEDSTAIEYLLLLLVAVQVWPPKKNGVRVRVRA